MCYLRYLCLFVNSGVQHVLTVFCIHDMAGVFYEARKAYPARIPGFMMMPGVWWVRVAQFVSFLCGVVLLCFVCLRPVSSVPSVASVSGFSIRFSLTFIL